MHLDETLFINLGSTMFCTTSDHDYIILCEHNNFLFFYEVLSSNTKKDQHGLLQIIRHQDNFFSGSGEHRIQAESVLHKW
jgi:hypothetical protein